uniref:Uncharacterized protein n=1 Tax=Apis cerana TaxID=7461 RepID=V9IF74_APICE
MPVQPYSGYRERLHPITTIPTSTMTSTLQYITPKFQTTEEVIYRPYNIPNWKTTFKSSTIRNENKNKNYTKPVHMNTQKHHIFHKKLLHQSNLQHMYHHYVKRSKIIAKIQPSDLGRVSRNLLLPESNIPFIHPIKMRTNIIQNNQII